MSLAVPWPLHRPPAGASAAPLARTVRSNDILQVADALRNFGLTALRGRTARGRRVTPDRVGAGWRGRLLVRAGGAVRNADNTTRK